MSDRPINRLAAYVPALRDCDDAFRLRLILHGFGLVWQDAAADNRAGLIAEEPAPFEQRWDAFLAAYAEQLAREEGIEVPEWALADRRYLKRFWYAGGCYDFDEVRTIVTTPGSFELHGIWLPREELEVV